MNNNPLKIKTNSNQNNIAGAVRTSLTAEINYSVIYTDIRNIKLLHATVGVVNRSFHLGISCSFI